MRIRFLFDYTSPFSYLAWCRLPYLAKELPKITIQHQPTPFANLAKHWGQRRTSEIPPKRLYVFTHCMRTAKEMNVPFMLPKYHPFDSTLALFLSLPQIAGSQQEAVISTLWRAAWQESKDLSNPDDLVKILQKANLPSSLIDMIGKCNIGTMQNHLEENNRTAIEAGVFGVPTFLLDDNTLFWGLDSLGHLKDYLTSTSNVEPQQVKAMLAQTTRTSATPT